MDIITKCVEETIKHLPTELSFTESNYQHCLSYFLSKFGTVENEVVLSYIIKDGGRKVCIGSGRIDVLFRAHGSNKVFLCELKISPKAYNIKYFIPQVKRYCHFYRDQFEECEGVIIVFSQFKSQCQHVVDSKLMLH